MLGQWGLDTTTGIWETMSSAGTLFQPKRRGTIAGTISRIQDSVYLFGTSSASDSICSVPSILHMNALI
jgi:hypothetical protein